MYLQTIMNYVWFAYINFSFLSIKVIYGAYHKKSIFKSEFIIFIGGVSNQPL
jgi:hypothetical protein